MCIALGWCFVSSGRKQRPGGSVVSCWKKRPFSSWQHGCELLPWGIRNMSVYSSGLSCVWWRFPRCLREQISPSLALGWPGVGCVCWVARCFPGLTLTLEHSGRKMTGGGMRGLFLLLYRYLVRLQGAVLHCCLLPCSLCDSQVFTIDRLRADGLARRDKFDPRRCHLRNS